MDNKMDDGNPHGGRVRAISDISPTAAGTTLDAGNALAQTGECVLTGLSTGPSYNTTNSDFASELNCTIRLQSAF
jgi:hypothetical protein